MTTPVLNANNADYAVITIQSESWWFRGICTNVFDFHSVQALFWFWINGQFPFTKGTGHLLV